MFEPLKNHFRKHAKLSILMIVFAAAGFGGMALAAANPLLQFVIGIGFGLAYAVFGYLALIKNRSTCFWCLVLFVVLWNLLVMWTAHLTTIYCLGWAV